MYIKHLAIYLACIGLLINAKDGSVLMVFVESLALNYCICWNKTPKNYSQKEDCLKWQLL